MKLDRIFTSHMVFASGLPIRIYGTGKGEAEITFAGKNQKIVSDADEWMVSFSPMSYGGPYELTFASADESVILSDIYVGEVYVFAGQSNMQFKMHTASTNEALYESCDNLRLFSTDCIAAGEYFSAKDGWVRCKREEVNAWSAIAYLSGIDIVKDKNVAVGIITCYQGASIIESWVPKDAFEKNGINIPIEEKHIDHYYEEYISWNTNGALYSNVLSQVLPFSVSAVVWYQGESDTSPAEANVYLQELAILIETWRNDFRNVGLPFVIIQLADYDCRNDEAWKAVQNAQHEIQYMLPNVKSVASRDVCESGDIHPPTKDVLSKRVASALKAFLSENSTEKL